MYFPPLAPPRLIWSPHSLREHSTTTISRRAAQTVFAGSACSSREDDVVTKVKSPCAWVFSICKGGLVVRVEVWSHYSARSLIRLRSVAKKESHPRLVTFLCRPPLSCHMGPAARSRPETHWATQNQTNDNSEATCRAQGPPLINPPLQSLNPRLFCTDRQAPASEE